MQLRYVFTELGQGLRRNLSMHIAVVLTLFVSLTLVGLGLLLNAQAKKAEDYWGSQLQITVFLCNKNSTSPNCTGEVTAAQKAAILKVIENNPEVEDQYVESQQTAFEKTKKLFGEEYIEKVHMRPEALNESIWITLKDARKYEGILSAVTGLDGVHSVRDARDLLEPIYKVIDRLKWFGWGAAGFLVVAALLLVANTIRLAAFARRREIGIMRLVGASSLYISLPFLLEALVTAAAGLFLAAIALGSFTWFGVVHGMSGGIKFMPWIGMSDYAGAMVWVAILGPVLTVLPTLVLTRKYLKV